MLIKKLKLNMHDASKINKVLLDKKALSTRGHKAGRASKKVICVGQSIIRTEGSGKLHSTQNTYRACDIYCLCDI